MSASRAIARPSILVALLMLLVPVGVALIPSALHASTITVNTLSDSSPSGDGLCSLREAINNANAKSDTSGGDCVAGTGSDTIVFSVSGTITLSGTLPAVANAPGESLTIDGSGEAITIDGAGLYQVLWVNLGATLNLNGLTIAHGNQPVGWYGGGVNNLGTLTVTNSIFSENRAGVAGNFYNGGQGGAIYNSGILSVTSSTFLDNNVLDYGGGIYNIGTATITDSAFSGNSTTGWGGAINTGGTMTVTDCIFSDNSATNGGGGGIASGGVLTVTNSTFSGNSTGTRDATGFGGGLANFGTLTVTNSTFSGNQAAVGNPYGYHGYGGGIDNSGSATVSNSTFFNNSVNAYGGAIYHESAPGYPDLPLALTVTDCTFSGNSATLGGGDFYNFIYSGGSTLTVNNSILANSTSGGDCAGGPLASSGYDISDDDSCGFGTSVAANGKTIGDNVNPLLDPNGLQNNGGPTETIALQGDSPAIDAIPIADCPPTDQRGAPRPDPRDGASDACDIGAFESGNVAWLAPSALDFGTVKAGQTSAASSVTLTNGSEKQIKIRGTAIGADFKIVSTTCSSVLNAGQSCDYMVSFEPRRAGTKNEAFRVTVTGASLKVTLEGVGTR